MHIDLNVTREILIYFDCWLSIICAHLFPIPLRQHHPVDMQIEAEEKSINIQLCTFHWLFIFPSVSFSVWYGDATWSLFKWNSALTLSHNSIILLDFLFFFVTCGGARLGLERVSIPSVSFTTSTNGFWWNFLDTRFLPCRLILRVKIISSTVRRTDISVKFYLNNIL